MKKPIRFTVIESGQEEEIFINIVFASSIGNLNFRDLRSSEFGEHQS